jgi:hypothetical protein
MLIKLSSLPCLEFRMQDEVTIQINNSSFERVEFSIIWEQNLRHENSIQEDIKRRLKSGNACYHSTQNLLSYSLLTKNIKINIFYIEI